MNEDEIRTLLQEALPPWRELEPARDLWPRLRSRLEARPAVLFWLWDAGAVALVLLLLALFPGLMPALVYHL
jgi:hypothetical protein